MTLAEIKQLLSTLLADSSTNFYTDSERLQAINSACSVMNSEARILMNAAEISMTTVDDRIPLPTDFVSLGRGLSWKDANGTITPLSRAVPFQLQEQGATTWETETGIPATYVLEGGNIYLTPRPNADGVIVLPYLAMPNKLAADTDAPFYGDPRIQAYHDMVAFYAAWQLTLKDRDFDAAAQFMNYFQKRFVDLKENLRHTGDIVIPFWTDIYSTS